ncbi:hypothetical protein [Streptomyces sp.]|uniref:hypothetical protein n=1 Tax=Streptomyces sp. TaxID=1931 RepID=UPI002F950146
MHEVKLSDGIITLSPLRLDDVEVHLKGEDEQLVRWLNGGPGTREGVEAYFRHCREQWVAAGPLRAFGIRVGAGEALAGARPAVCSRGLGPRPGGLRTTNAPGRRVTAAPGRLGATGGA